MNPFIKQDWKPRDRFQLSLEEVMANTQPVQMPQGKRGSGDQGFLSSLMSEGGALGGAALGAAAGSAVPVIGTAIGGILGAGLGAFGGRLAENQVRDNEFRVGDAAKEGALTTVLAGPLKLGKYAMGAGKAAKAGAGITGALASGADDAAKFTLRGAVGNKLSGTADDLVTKQFRFTPSQLKNFKGKFGEDAGEVLRKYGMNNADDIAKKGIQPLQTQFDDLVQAIPGVPKETVRKNLNKRISELSKAAPSDSKALAKQLKAESDTLLAQFDDVVDPKQLNQIKNQFDSLVNYTEKTANPSRYGVNKRVADAVRESLQQSDSSGSLKTVGRELQKLRQLADNAAKQAELGKGSLPLGLSTLLGGTAGGAAFGPAGVGTAAGVAAVNSTAGRKAIAGGTGRLANRLMQAEGGALWNASKGIAGTKLIDTLTNQSANSTMNPSTNPNATAPNNASTTSPSGLGQVNQTDPSLSSEFIQIDNQGNLIEPVAEENNDPFAPANIQRGIETILANGGDLGDAMEFMQMAQAMQELKAGPEPPKLNNTAIQGITDLQTGIDNLGLLEQRIQSSDANSPGLGSIRSKLPWDTEAKSLRAEIDRVKQVVGKALEGGVLRKEDEEKYARILPTISDTDEVAMRKLAAIRADLQNKLTTYVNNQSTMGGGGSSLEEALVQYQ